MPQLNTYQVSALETLSDYFSECTKTNDPDTAFYGVTKKRFGQGIPYRPIRGMDGMPYEIANQIFAVLAIAALAGNSGLHFEYEQADNDLIGSLANPDTDGYYDLPAVADDNGNYLCIPLPLVNTSFMNDFVKKGAIYQERQEHEREYLDLEGQELEQFGLSIRQEFDSMLDDTDLLNQCVSTVLRFDSEGDAEPVSLNESV